MIREASEIASICEELVSPDFQKIWDQVRSSNLATEKPGLAKLADIFLMAGLSGAQEKLEFEWNSVSGHCNALLQIFERLPTETLVDEASLRLAEVIYSSFAAGGKKRWRHSAVIQSRKARAARKRKVDKRGQIIRKAIAVVCDRECLVPVASEKFAASIRPAVIEAAAKGGLADSRSGMSIRSIQRHIAALLKDPRM